MRLYTHRPLAVCADFYTASFSFFTSTIAVMLQAPR
ncbi:hypothetical protein LDHU3_29.2610:CDS1 [Leishmania donovani]|nr:hypothetical protein LDHU3_29.2610:CDS1 [Leishmania donovani]